MRPHNFPAELKNTRFKEALVNFFIKHWSSGVVIPFIVMKTIFLSYDACYSYKVENNQVTTKRSEVLSCSSHAEAEVLIKCSVTNILLILLGYIDYLNATLKLWM